MTLIRSMVDLRQAEAEAMERQRASLRLIRFDIRVGVSSCSLAAGAGNTIEALKRQLKQENLEGVRITQVGCNGWCSLEPIVIVQEVNRPPVTYGKVTAEVARRIVQRHIKKGLVVQEYVIENM